MCKLTCPIGYYPGASNLCVYCDSACRACTGSGSSSCTECTPGYFLDGN